MSPWINVCIFLWNVCPRLLIEACKKSGFNNINDNNKQKTCHHWLMDNNHFQLRFQLEINRFYLHKSRGESFIAICTECEREREGFVALQSVSHTTVSSLCELRANKRPKLYSSTQLRQWGVELVLIGSIRCRTF